MKWLGLVLAVVIIAVGAWFDWTYHAIRTEIADLQSVLPPEEALDRMAPEQTAEQLNLANSNCLRVDKLKASAIAKLLKRSEIQQLSDQCDLIRARKGSLEGP
jgi:hypothetical protein